ncbi:MAG: outer membrane beta-barrel protein [Acidobacteriota bacterium]|nr:outer membrane beta-barrel protein [Acidobacteriota bacterium]
MPLSVLQRATLLSVLLVALATPARAQDIFAVPFAGLKFGGATSIFDLEFAAGKKTFTMGGSVVVLGNGVFGYEADFGYMPNFFNNKNSPPLYKPGSYVIDLSGGVIFAVPESVTRGGLRPYAVAGVGLAHAQAADGLEIFQVRRTVPAFKIGIGAQALLLTNNVGIRFDLRHVRSFTGDDGSLARVGRRISYSRFTIGLLLRL